MKYGPLKLESLLPWKLKLLASPQGHFSHILIVFFIVCVCVCVSLAVFLSIKCREIGGAGGLKGCVDEEGAALKRRRTFSPSYLMRWGGALLILACMHLPLIPLLSPLCCSLECNSSNFWQFSSQIKNRRKNKQNQEEVFQTNCQASAEGAEIKAAAQSFCSRRVQICPWPWLCFGWALLLGIICLLGLFCTAPYCHRWHGACLLF